MQVTKKAKGIEGEKEKRTRTRVRTVDFMRIEDNSNRQELSPFELEVKEAITNYKTPLTELIEKEEEEDYEKLIERVYGEAQKANFTRNERKCFKLIFKQDLSFNEAAHVMKLTPARVANLKGAVIKKMKSRVQRALRKDPEFLGLVKKFPNFRISM